MKKLSLVLSIVALTIAFTPVNKAEAAPECTLTADSSAGEYIVNFSGKTIFSNASPGSIKTENLSIPAGTYNLTAVTWDNHSSHGGQGQTAEKVKFIASNNGTKLFTTSATKDIAESKNFQTTTFGSSYTANNTITTLVATHAARGTGNYQSVVPLCVKFTPVSTPPPSPDVQVSCDASPSSVQTGQTVTWDADASGGNGSYTYSWTGAVTSSNESPTSSYSSTGTKTATVTVTSGGKTASATCSVNVSSTPSNDLQVSCDASPSSVRTGETITWDADASGGNGSYTYSWSSGSSNEHFTNSYSSTGTRTQTVTVTSGSQTKSATCSVNVTNNSSSSFDVTCRASDTRIEEGDSVTFTADVDGGDSPFDYDWNGDISGDSRSETVRFTRSGRYDVEVTVTDDNGQRRTDSCPVIVVEDPENDDLDVVCRVSDTSINSGDRVTFTADVDGGNSPYDYDWRGDISGNDRTESVRFSREGRYEVRVTVEDDDGNRASDTCPVVRVTNEVTTGQYLLNTTTFYDNPPSAPLSSLSSVYLSQIPYTGAKEVLTIIGYIALVFVWSAGILYFLARRKSKKAKTNSIEAFKNANKQAVVIE